MEELESEVIAETKSYVRALKTVNPEIGSENARGIVIFINGEPNEILLIGSLNIPAMIYHIIRQAIHTRTKNNRSKIERQEIAEEMLLSVVLAIKQLHDELR